MIDLDDDENAVSYAVLAASGAVLGNLDDDEIEVSYVDRYKQKIAERKQRKSAIIPDSLLPNNAESALTPKIAFSNTAFFAMQVSEKIDAICVIDREYQEMLSFADAAKRRAESAKQSAQKAAEQSSGFLCFTNRKAIESLQASDKEQALALEANTQALTKITALQEKIINATKAVFTLGVSNIAENRSVYQQLEMKLQGASEQELSDFAQKEILAVMKQLNKHLDIMAKQEHLKDKLHQQQESIDDLKVGYNQLKEKNEQLEAEVKKIYSENVAQHGDKKHSHKTEKRQPPVNDYEEEQGQLEADKSQHQPDKTEADESEKEPKKKGGLLGLPWNRKR